jgi:hypothetical protein
LELHLSTLRTLLLGLIGDLLFKDTLVGTREASVLVYHLVLAVASALLGEVATRHVIAVGVTAGGFPVTLKPLPLVVALTITKGLGAEGLRTDLD